MADEDGHWRFTPDPLRLGEGEHRLSTTVTDVAATPAATRRTLGTAHGGHHRQHHGRRSATLQVTDAGDGWRSTPGR
ncbi:hypothetical protein ACVCFV_02685 [Klebsiella pneumoniae]